MAPEIVIGILGIVVGAVVTLFSVRRQNEVSRKIARDSGSFSRPDILVGVCDFAFSMDSRDRNVVCVALPTNFSRRVVTVCPIPFTVLNQGKKSLRNAVLSVQARTDILYYSKELSLKGTCGALREKIKRSCVTNGDFNNLSYEIDSIDPKVKFNLTEPFRFRPWMDYSLARTVKTKDGVPLEYEVKASVVFTCLVTLMGEDFEPLAVKFTFDCLQAASLEEAKRRWLESAVDSDKPLPRTHVTFVAFEQNDTRDIEGQRVIRMKMDKWHADQKVYWTDE